MADLVLGVAGGIIGSMYGNWHGGFSIGMMLGSILFPPDLGTYEVGRIDDFRIQGMSQGSHVPRVWGKYRLAGQVIWSTSIEEKITIKKEGGFSGGGGITTKTYSYSTTFALMICEGPVTKIRRIWANAQVIYDNRTSPEWADWVDENKITFYLGTETQTPDPVMEGVEGVGNVPAYRGYCYIVFEDLALFNVGNSMPNMTIEVDTGVNNVDDILNDLCDDVGIIPSERDFTTVDSIAVGGFALATRIEARNAMEMLSIAYFFDMVEIDGKLKTKVQGTVPIDTLDDDWIGCNTNALPQGEKINTVRQQEIELPREITVNYISEAADFNSFSQAARTIVRTSEDQRVIQLPLLLGEDQAKIIAEKMLWVAWLQRNMHSFTLSWRDLDKAPGDIVTIPTDLGDRDVKIIDMSMTLLGHIRVVGVEDKPFAYVQSATGGVPFGDTSGVQGNGPIDFEVADLNAVIDEDADNIGFYASAAATGVLWPGCNIQSDITIRGTQRRARGTKLPFDFETHCAIGESTTILAVGPTAIIDESSIVRVSMTRGLLENAPTDLDLLNGYNVAILGLEIFS